MQFQSDPVDAISENEPAAEIPTHAAPPSESIKIEQVESAIQEAESVIFYNND